MKGSAKKKTGSEAPIDASNGGAGDGDVPGINGAGDSLAPPSAENNNYGFVLKGDEGEITPLQDSEREDEEEGPEEEEEEEEGEEEREEEKKDGDTVAKEGQGPKLDDDFYEVEAIRRKRMRKGELQYLVKWSNWPESANTWEPLENLNSVPDLIDAFENSLKSGKLRKRKRKHVVQHTQIKKRQQRSASYSLRRFAPPVADNHPQSAPLVDPSTPDIPARPHTVIFADDGENNGKVTRAVKNGSANVSKQNVEKDLEPDYDPKLRELKAITINGNDADKVAMQFQEARTSTGNGQMGGQCKADSGETSQSGCCRGAKRRKSGSVKRFKNDSYSAEPVDAQKTLSGGAMEHARTGTLSSAGNGSYKKVNDANTACDIVKLIRPVGYSAFIADGNAQKILVTFVALRNDGARVIVDNKYLKLNNPLLLINFYEQHLRYTPTPTP